jgi:hypothetical protein
MSWIKLMSNTQQKQNGNGSTGTTSRTGSATQDTNNEMNLSAF